MTIRILLIALLTVILGAGPPEPPPKNPDVAFANAMKARAERARLKASRSLSETLTEEPKVPVVKSPPKQRQPPKPKRQVYIVRRETITPALRASFSGTRRFCFGKCGR